MQFDASQALEYAERCIGPAYMNTPGSENVLDGNFNHSPPVARLKRRIISRRTEAIQMLSETENSNSNGNVESKPVRRQRPKSSYGRPATPVSLQPDALDEREMVRQNNLKDRQVLCAHTPESRQRPKSACERLSIPVSLQRTNDTNKGAIVQENTIKEYPDSRPKIPQPRHIKTYLERWKEAQLESRPCTAMGLMALERKQSTSLSSTETKPRKAQPSPFKFDKTTTNTGSAKDPTELLQKMRHLKEVLESAKGNNKKFIKNEAKSSNEDVLFSRPKTHSTLKYQRERLENLLRNSKNCVSERSQTSLGPLTSHSSQLVKFSNDNISRKNNFSRKSVTFETRPITPWVIARHKERPCTPGEFLHSEERPQTPGIPLTRNRQSKKNIAIDSISGVSETNCGEQYTDVINTVQFANSDHRHVTAETHIPKEKNCPSSTFAKRENISRRIIAARSQYSDSDRKIETDQESVSLLKSSKVHSPKIRTRLSADIFSEYRRKPKDGNAPINGYSKPHIMTGILSSTDNENIWRPEAESVFVQRGAKLVTDKLVIPTKAVQGRITVGQLKGRYYEKTRKFTSTLTQPIRCQSTPITPRVKTFSDQESGIEDLSNKEDRILSWLGDCEESSLPTHLPVISFNEKGSQ